MHIKRSRRQPVMQSRLEWIRRLGFVKASRAIFWKLKTAASKRWMAAQDHHAWHSYAQWIRENEHERSQPVKVESGPSACFLIPVFSESLPALAITLDSLIAQTNSHWEACLIIEKTCAAELRAQIIRTWQDLTRILIIEFEEDEGLAGGYHRALDSTSSSWIGWMECGDCLAPGALTACVQAISQYSQADLIYSDEDHLGLDGRTRRDPFFKPDWSPDLLLSINYLAHALFRRDIFIASASASNDIEDIIYRCAERAQSVVHIPQVLYHIHPEASLSKPAGIPDSAKPSPSTLSAHLLRLGIAGVTAQVSTGRENRVSWVFEEKLISIIIPTRDQVENLRVCIESLLNLTRYKRFEILLVENNSQEAQTRAYYAELQSRPQVRIIEDNRGFNYSSANNLGARQAKGEWLLFLNNDIQIFEPDWLDEMARWLSRPEIGVVGAKLLYPDGAIQHAGIVIGLEGHASHIFAGDDRTNRGPFGSPDWYRNYSAVTGACLATRREVFDNTGGFDENYELVFSDVEYCQRVIQHGYRVVYTPFARLVHKEGRTRQRHIPLADIRRGAEQLAQVVKHGDPYYNPNLSYAIKTPTLKRMNEETPGDRLHNIVDYS